MNINRFQILTITFFMLLISLSDLAKGQEKVTLYYNSNWEVTKKEKAKYFREAVFDLNTFKLDGEVKDYSINGNLLMSGNYNTDKRNGEFTFNYDNGVPKSKGYYKENTRIGNWEYFYENGKVKQKAFFFEDPKKNFFAITEFFERNGNQLIKNGTGVWINDSIESNSLEKGGLFRLTGQFKDSLKTGTWKLNRISDNKTIHTEQFKKGRFIEATVWEPLFSSYGTTNFEFLNKFPDENLERLSKTENFALDTTEFPSSLLTADVPTILRMVTGKNYFIKNRRAGYPYGDQALLEFIGSNIRYPISAIQNKISGKVYIKVLIDSIGKPREVSVFRGVDKDLDNEALRVIKLIDNWLPALREGKQVESSISIPVSFDIKQ